MTKPQIPPDAAEFELTLLGPGYGESIVMHIGDGAWFIVDSCTDSDGTPRAIRYFNDIGVDAAKSVVLIAVTHWHDDHIRGIGNILKHCSRATLCCLSALRSEEFLTFVGKT